MQKFEDIKYQGSSSKTINELTPEQLFDEFRKDRGDKGWRNGYKAIKAFENIENKEDFLDKTFKFITDTKDDRIRSWGMTVLEKIGGNRSFTFICNMFIEEVTKEKKRKFLRTRFFALEAITNLSKTAEEKDRLLQILKKVSNDKEEDYLAQAGATVILLYMKSLDHDHELLETARSRIRDWLNDEHFWPRFHVLRALRDFPILGFEEDIIKVNSSLYYDHKNYAIRALGSYSKLSHNGNSHLKIIRELGLIIRNSEEDGLRLNAIESIINFQSPDSQEDLIFALQDKNAEVRLQSSKALKFILQEEAIPIIIQKSLKEGISEDYLANLIESLRIIDPDKNISTQILSNELMSKDQKRSKIAEKIMLELGGWGVLQSLGQRRKSLDTLDKLLEKSEEAIKDTFHDTITQARRNFYFAMGVNIIIVITGIILISVAISQLMQDPEKFGNWIIPGAGGVFGIILTMYFNNPRKNARQDLTTLMNVNIIFLGFLRRLNQIDATFKHMYIENATFSSDDMDKTINQIENAVSKSLAISQAYLQNINDSYSQIDPSETEKNK